MRRVLVAALTLGSLWVVFDRAVEALSLFTEVSQIVRLCIDGDFNPEEAPSGLVDLVCRAGDYPDLTHLEADIRRYSRDVRRIFQALIAA